MHTNLVDTWHSFQTSPRSLPTDRGYPGWKQLHKIFIYAKFFPPQILFENHEAWERENIYRRKLKHRTHSINSILPSRSVHM